MTNKIYTFLIYLKNSFLIFARQLRRRDKNKLANFAVGILDSALSSPLVLCVCGELGALNVKS